MSGNASISTTGVGVGGIVGYYHSAIHDLNIIDCVCGSAEIKTTNSDAGAMVHRIVGGRAESSAIIVLSNNKANPDMLVYGSNSGNTDGLSPNGDYSGVVPADQTAATNANGANWAAGTDYAANCPAQNILPIVTLNPQNGESSYTLVADANGKFTTQPPVPSVMPANAASFKGWYDAPENGTAWTANTVYPFDSKLYAQWNCKSGFTYNPATKACEDLTRTITYESKGAQVGSETVNLGDIIAAAPSPEPSMTDGSFSGWYDSVTNERWVFGAGGTKVTGNHTLVARFGCNSGYHLDGNACVADPPTTCRVSFVNPSNFSADQTPDSKVFGCGTSYRPEAPTTPYSQYHTFLGWFKGDGTQWNFSTDSTTTDLTLYSHWQCGMGFTGGPTAPCVFNENGCDPGWEASPDKTHCVQKKISITVTTPGGSSDNEINYGDRIPQPQIPTVDNAQSCAWYLVGAPNPFDFNTPITGPIELELRCVCNAGHSYDPNLGCVSNPNGCNDGETACDDGDGCCIIVEVLYPNGKEPEYFKVKRGDTFKLPKGPSTPHGTFIGWLVQQDGSARQAQRADSGSLRPSGDLITVNARITVIPVFMPDPGFECDASGCEYSGSCPSGYTYNGSECVPNGGGSVNLPPQILTPLGNVIDSIGNVENAIGDIIGMYKLMFDKSLALSVNPQNDMVATSQMVERAVGLFAELESHLSTKLCCATKVFTMCGCE
ncbi:MAG: InlB B-repeat-containing protein [Oscillospiraceae bacterium]|nr:InlB B-repeat-containing protein [Oscillospiraceae bacterium]